MRLQCGPSADRSVGLHPLSHGHPRDLTLPPVAVSNVGVDQAGPDDVHSLFRVSRRSDLPAMRRSRGRAASESRLDATQLWERPDRPA
jgi:hypothetical protein